MEHSEVHPASSTAAPGQRRLARARSRGLAGPCLRWAGGGCFALTLLLLCGGFYLYQFASGPVPIEWLRGRILAKLERSLGAGGMVSLTDARVERMDDGPRLVLEGFRLQRADGSKVVAAPRAEIDFDPWSLLSGNFSPRRIDLIGLELRIARDADGGIHVLTTAPDGARLDGVKPEHAKLDEETITDTAPGEGVVAGMIAAIDALTSTDGPMRDFDRFGLRQGRLIIEDAERGARYTLDDVQIAFDAPQNGPRRLDVSARGATGPVAFQVEAVRGTDNVNVAKLTIARLPFVDVLKAADLNPELFSPMNATGTMTIALKPDRSVTQLEGRLETSGGHFLGSLPDFPPFPINSLQATFVFDPVKQSLAFPSIEARSGNNEFKLAARADPGPAGRVALVIESGQATLDPARQGRPLLSIASLNGRLDVDSRGDVTIGNVHMVGPKLDVNVNGLIALRPDGEGLKLDIQAKNTDIEAGLRLWPQLAAQHVRDYLLHRLDRGTLDRFSLSIALDPANFAAANKGAPLADDALRIDVTGSNATLFATDGLPAIEAEQMTGRFTGRTASVSVPRGSISLPDNLQLSVTEGLFSIADTAKPDTPAKVGLRLQGAAPAVADLLESEALKPFVALDQNIEVTKGSADLRLGLALPLIKQLKPTDVQIQLSGVVTGMRIEGVVPNENLQDVNLALNLDRGVFTAKGDGKIFGANAVLDTRYALKGGGESSLSFTLDEATRSKRGLPVTPQLSGPLSIKMVQAYLPSRESRPRIEVDLTRAGIDDLVPGWSKPVGKPGKVSFLLTRRDKEAGTDLQELSIESAGFQIKGAISLDADNRLRSAKLSQARFSPGDDVKLDLDRTPNGMKATVKANVMDARPFLRTVLAGPSEHEAQNASGPAQEMELDLKAAILTGHNSEVITNAELKLAKRGTQVRQFQLSGRFGRSSLTGQVAKRADGSPVVVVQTTDGGGLLRFTDLYKRMVGGVLVLQIAPNEKRQDGIISIRDYALRDEPALRRMFPDGASSASSSASGERGERMSPTGAGRSEVGFEKAKIEFVRTNGRLELRDAVMWGPQVGATIEGTIDIPRDRVNLTGTFVPAYALNNAFAQVPVVGMLLGGGQYGGLFAVSFRVSGAASAPTMTVNPLSAIAPGFLRKFFEFRRTNEGPSAVGTIDQMTR